MGTNYYLHDRETCNACGRKDEGKHIGKSSYGWYFALHVEPSEGINDLDDWIPLLSAPEAVIKDEYGDKVSFEEMMKIITERCNKRECMWSSAEYSNNHAEPGEHYLVRAKLGHGCLKHGNGTWDCITGVFS